MKEIIIISDSKQNKSSGVFYACTSSQQQTQGSLTSKISMDLVLLSLIWKQALFFSFKKFFFGSTGVYT
jgi:hypothetical protein